MVQKVFENSKSIASHEYTVVRDLNLAKMLLGQEGNMSDDFNKIETLFDSINSIDELRLSDEFKNSIEASKIAFNDISTRKLYIEKLKINNPSSFLILPLYSSEHLWTALVRKTDEGYSLTSINKGQTAFHKAYEEHIFNDPSTILAIVNTTTKRDKIQIKDVYDSLSFSATKLYKLNVLPRSQKCGNCFVKNVEAAIKFAHATKNFSPTDFYSLRIEELAFGQTQNFQKIKWDGLTTSKFHNLLVKRIIASNPAIKNEAMKCIDNYDKNKIFRKILKETSRPLDALNIFSLPEDFGIANISLRIAKQLKQVDSYSFTKYRARIKEIVNLTNNSDLKASYDNLKYYDELLILLENAENFTNFVSLGANPSEALLVAFKENYTNDEERKIKIEAQLKKLPLYSLLTCKASIHTIIKELNPSSDTNKVFEQLMSTAVPPIYGPDEQSQKFIYNLKKVEEYFPQPGKLLCNEWSYQFNKLATYHELQANSMRDPKYFNAAINLLNVAVMLSPSECWNYKSRGKIHFTLKNFKEASKDFQKFVNLNPFSEEGYYNCGSAFFNINDYDNSIKYLRKALELNPYNTHTLLLLAQSCNLNNDFSNAVACCNQLLYINPRNADATFERALAHKGNGDYEHAIADFSEAIVLNYRNQADAYWMRSECHYANNLFFKALTDIDIALNKDPNNPKYLATQNKIEAASKKENSKQLQTSFSMDMR